VYERVQSQRATSSQNTRLAIDLTAQRHVGNVGVAAVDASSVLVVGIDRIVDVVIAITELSLQLGASGACRGIAP
jgi:hypothetical protein